MLFIGAGAVKAQYTVLANTGSGPAYGLTPSVSGDTLFGVCNDYAAEGAVFGYTKAGGFGVINQITPLYGVSGALTLSGDFLYGTAISGTSVQVDDENGGIYAFNYKTGICRAIESFGIDSGGHPIGKPVLINSYLCGMEQYENGAIYSVDTNGGNLSTFYLSDGEEPWGSLTLSVTGDTVFGMTSAGGGNGDGTIFFASTYGVQYGLGLGGGGNLWSVLQVTVELIPEQVLMVQ